MRRMVCKITYKKIEMISKSLKRFHFWKKTRATRDVSLETVRVFLMKMPMFYRFNAIWLAPVAGNILYTCYTRTIYKYLVARLLSTFSDLSQTLSIQSRQPDLVAVLRKFQNVPYNACDIFVKDVCKCSNVFTNLKRYAPSSSIFSIS